jgi:hypothetical protein
MKQALDYMLQLIEDGYDYMDALDKTAAKFKISCCALQEAYDLI